MSAADVSSRDTTTRSWGARGTAAATFAGRLRFEHVSMNYGRVEAVRDVTFELAPGEIVCLLGPSGCGKTSVLRVAAGVERPQTGRVMIDQLEAAGPARFVPPEKRGIGLMFQDFALFPHLSILENVAFGLKGLPRAAARAEAQLALKRVGMADFARSYPHALSGGEQQRVALARATVPRPQVMLMDEPFSGLDQRLRESVREETLALLKETRATTMLVTHDPVEAMGMADRILLMRQGRLVQAGTPTELYQHPVDADAARYFSDFNEIPVTIKRGKAETPVGSFDAPGLAEGERALVMIRPQGFETAVGVGLEGYVLSSHFLGDCSQCSVLFKGIDEPLKIRLPAKHTPKRAETALFAIDPRHALVFPHPG
jgi:iron(III) transport system ATP-binding protein